MIFLGYQKLWEVGELPIWLNLVPFVEMYINTLFLKVVTKEIINVHHLPINQ